MHMKHLAHRKDSINCSYYLKLRVQDLEKFFPFVTSKGSCNTLGWYFSFPSYLALIKGNKKNKNTGKSRMICWITGYMSKRNTYISSNIHIRCI